MSPEPRTGRAGRVALRPAMNLRDVVLFFVTAGTNLQWVATAAAAGPSSLFVWLLGCMGMFVPLGFCVIALASRYPEEGGLYAWSKRAFGPFAGFMTGWTYWMSNLPYFPGVLYFAAGNALFMGGESWQALSSSPAYFIGASILGLALATALNLVGLDVGKWLTNVGALGRWLATAMLLALGALAWWRFGSATEVTLASLRPGLRLQDLMFWSTIAFALTGFEAASFMGEEIRESRSAIPRGIVAAAPIITGIYVLGTASVLVALPEGEVSGLQGVMQAIRSAAGRLELTALVPIAAAVIAVSSLGSVSAWLAAVARIPFVAGLDHFLPEAFSRLHPRWGSPYVALLTQSLITIVVIFLGQAGTSVKGAYGVIVSMTLVATFIPFLFIFASAIKLTRESAAPGEVPVPDGRPMVLVLGAVGLLTTAASLVLSVFPAEDEPDKVLAVTKVLGLTLLTLGAGAAVYLLGRRRAARYNPPA